MSARETSGFTRGVHCAGSSRRGALRLRVGASRFTPDVNSDASSPDDHAQRAHGVNPYRSEETGA